jgi:hypothetical protein
MATFGTGSGELSGVTFATVVIRDVGVKIFIISG